LEEQLFRPRDVKNTSIEYDSLAELSNANTREKYDKPLRLIQVWDEEKMQYLELLTNNTSWTAPIRTLLLKLLQKEAKYTWHLCNLVAFVRINLFVKIDLKTWLDKPFLDPADIKNRSIQIALF
jgi:hypothetical protein